MGGGLFLNVFVLFFPLKGLDEEVCAFSVSVIRRLLVSYIPSLLPELGTCRRD